MGVRRSLVQWKKSRQLRSQMRHNQKKVFTMRQFEKESMKNKGFFFALVVWEVDEFKE